MAFVLICGYKEARNYKSLGQTHNSHKKTLDRTFGPRLIFQTLIEGETMAESFTSSRQSLIPSFLYSSSLSSSSFLSKRSVDLDAATHGSGTIHASSSTPSKRVMIQSPKETIELYSPAYFAACTVGGMLATGPTHTAVTPFDLVKCNMQVYMYYLDTSSSFLH